MRESMAMAPQDRTKSLMEMIAHAYINRTFDPTSYEDE